MNPNVFQFEVFDCTALDAIVRTGFRTHRDGVETDFCGLRGVYRHDELSWDEDGAGFWRSGAAPQSIPTGLMLENSIALPRAKVTQRDTVLRVASDAGVVARWGFLYSDKVLPSRVRVWGCATGGLVYNEVSNTSSAVIGMLPEGSYTIAVAIEGAMPKHMSEAEYRSLVGFPVSSAYFYEENGARYFYDFDRNLGVRPSNPQHALNVARAEVETSGAQQDKAEWIQHATTHSTFNSQWVMAKFVVGDGSWEREDSVLAAPDAALLAASTGDETIVVTPANVGGFALAFDPFARSIACYFKDSSGIEYIGGERSCADGTETALWQWNDGEATLLATSRNYSTGLCECAGLQSAHEARRIVEDFNGEIIVQTLCSLLRYDPHGASIEQKLVPHPKATDGHPGGRSLLSHGKSLCYTTEYFGKKSDGEPAAQFYDTFVTRSGEVGAQSGIGTVAHVDGNLALWMNRVYGIVQNRMDATAEDAVQAVAFMSPAGWRKPGVQYDASEYQLQRTARIGWHLVATGKERQTENSRFRSSDGYFAQFGESEYRLRQIDAVMNTSGFETGLAPGFLPTDGEGSLRYPRRLIEIGERATGRILDDEPNPRGDVTCSDAQCQLEEFGEGAVWFGEPLVAWGSAEISGVTVIDPMRPGTLSEARPFSEYFAFMQSTGNALVWARIDSTDDVDDLESYRIPINTLGDLFMLPYPAKIKVEFVVILPSDAEGVEPLRLIGVC